MKKIDLFIDFDGTIVNSKEAACNVYNEKYRDHPDFKEAVGSDIYFYDCSDECPLAKYGEVVTYFSHDTFWDTLTLKEGALETIKWACESGEFNVAILTYGTNTNLSKKAKWCSENLNIKGLQFIGMNSGALDKQRIVGEGILVDDLGKNLINPYGINILFKDLGDKEYNEKFTKGKDGRIVESMYDLQEELAWIVYLKNFTLSVDTNIDTC